MEQAYLDVLFEDLAPQCLIAPGLSDTEVERVESSHGFKFPPDLREILQYRLPLDRQSRKRMLWPNWRSEDRDEIQDRLDSPLHGVLFDVEHNGFWLDNWGERPSSLLDAFEIATQQIRNAPMMIPIRGHRFLPADPCVEGNPFFSIHQTDIIYYGYDLASYFNNDCAVRFPRSVRTLKARYIDFWTDLTERNGYGFWWDSPALPG